VRAAKPGWLSLARAGSSPLANTVRSLTVGADCLARSVYRAPMRAGLIYLAFVCGSPLSTRPRVLGRRASLATLDKSRAPHLIRGQSRMASTEPTRPSPPPPPPQPLDTVFMQTALLVGLFASGLGAYVFLDNRFDAVSKEAAAANKETAMQLAAASKETAMQLAAASKETAMQLAALNSNLTISAIAILCVALLFVAISKSGVDASPLGASSRRSHRRPHRRSRATTITRAPPPPPADER